MMRRSIRSARREFPRPGPGLAAALVACLAGAALCGGEPEVPEVPSAELSRLSKQFDVKRVKRTVASLAALGSRVPGQPGNEKAVDFVLEALRDPALGLDKVGTQQFEMPAPVDKGSFIEVVPEGGGPRRIKLEPLWPNLIRTTSCRVPAEGDGTVPLIYVHGGQLSQYKGLPARGSVVLMDFNSGMRWLDAANLGAQAIIFVEPDEALRGEAEEKFLRSPLDMPRFWVSREVGRELVDLCERDGPKAIDCRVGSKVVWESTVVRNVYGLLKGTGDGLELEEDEAPELLLVGSHLDSMSVVPSLAPGAEGATGAAFLLELARIFARHPPRRDVLFLLTNSHYMHLKGMRHFYNLVNSDLDDYEKSIIQLNKEAGTSRAMAWVVERRPELDDPANRQVLRTMALQIIEEQGGFEKLPGADRWKYFLMAELIGCALFLGCLVAYCLVKRREGLQTSVLAGGLAIWGSWGWQFGATSATAERPGRNR